MARGITVSGTSGTATASGGTAAVHITGLPNYFDITKIKITPSGGSGPYKVEVFKKDTLGGADLMGKWPAAATNIYEPMDNSSGSPAEGNASAYIIVYEDADGTGELHLKFTNNDTSDRTYSYTVVYQETWVFDSSRIASAQKAELLGDVLYFGGRTSSQSQVKRNGTALVFRVGDDTAYANLECADVVAHGGDVFVGGITSGNVRLRASGSTTLAVRLGDDSAYTQLDVASLLAHGSIVYLGGNTASEVSLRRSGTALQVALGDNSALTQVTAASFLSGSGIYYLDGNSASEVSLRRSGTVLLVRLGDNSAYANLVAAEIQAQTTFYLNGNAATDVSLRRSTTTLLIKLGDNSGDADVQARNGLLTGSSGLLFVGSTSNDVRINKNGNFTLRVQKGDGSGLGDIECGTITPGVLNYNFGGITDTFNPNSISSMTFQDGILMSYS